MANNAARYGFAWHSALQGPSLPKFQRMPVASGLALVANPGSVSVSLQPGDPVKYVSDGSVTLCASDEAVYGVVAGIGAQQFSGNGVGYYPYLDSVPSGTTYTNANEDSVLYVHVIPVAGMIFECSVDDNTTFTTFQGYRSAVNNNVTYVYQPNATTKSANGLIDISTQAVTSTLGLRILDLSRRVDVDYTGTFVPLLVTFNKVQQTPYQTTGV